MNFQKSNENIIFANIGADQLYTYFYSESHKPSTYAAYIRGNRCPTEESFFKEISAALQFPYYFGENWGAFDECMCDLEWLSFSRIVLFIDNFTKVFNENQLLQGLLIKYVNIFVNYWETENIECKVIISS